ncbi:hypothetical protein ACFIOY_22200 [Bradyrhizobium sp. TZ2]
MVHSAERERPIVVIATIRMLYMRHAIETAPKNGKLLILEDDASGTYAVAHWATDRDEWVGKDSQPSKIVPTHWLSIERDDKAILGGNEQSSSPAQIEKRAAWAPRRSPWRKTTLIAAGLIGIYLFVSGPSAQQETAPTNTSLGRVVERHSEASTHTAAVRRNMELDTARRQPDGQDASAGDSQQSLGDDLRREALSNELAAARGAIEARDNQIRALDRQLRDQEGELASIRRDIEAKVAVLTELQQQHDRAETLAAELATTHESARGATEARDSQIRALDRQLRDREGELASVRRDVEAKVALLTELQQQRDRAESLVSELATTHESARGAIEVRDSQIRALDRQLRDRESELASVRRDVEAKVAVLTELQQQRDRAETLAAEPTTTTETARGAIEARDSQIRALDRQLRDQEGELASARRDVEAKVALLTELQQRDRAETLAAEPTTTHEATLRDFNAHIASERAANKVPVPPTQTVAAAPPYIPATGKVLPALPEPGPEPTATAPAPDSQAILKIREPKKQAERLETTRKELRVERRQRYAERKARRKQGFFSTLSEPGVVAFYGGGSFGNYRIAGARLKQRRY